MLCLVYGYMAREPSACVSRDRPVGVFKQPLTRNVASMVKEREVLVFSHHIAMNHCHSARVSPTDSSEGRHFF